MSHLNPVALIAARTRLNFGRFESIGVNPYSAKQIADGILIKDFMFQTIRFDFSCESSA